MLFVILLFYLGEEQDERQEIGLKMNRHILGKGNKKITAGFNDWIRANADLLIGCDKE